MSDRPVAQERDGWTSMFQPDVLAGAHYMERWRHQPDQEPEKMLMYAVLDDAITCFQKFSSASSKHGKSIFREAEHWLMHEKSDWPFSFEHLCEGLNLDPDYIRAGLLRWRSATPRQTNTRLFYVVRTGR